MLDEIWSIDFSHFRLKSSFGTAIKFWGDCWWSNLATYANVIILAMMILQDPSPERGPMPGRKQRHDGHATGRPRIEIADQPDGSSRRAVPLHGRALESLQRDFRIRALAGVQQRVSPVAQVFVEERSHVIADDLHPAVAHLERFGIPHRHVAKAIVADSGNRDAIAARPRPCASHRRRAESASTRSTLELLASHFPLRELTIGGKRHAVSQFHERLSWAPPLLVEEEMEANA